MVRAGLVKDLPVVEAHEHVLVVYVGAENLHTAFVRFFVHPGVDLDGVFGVVAELEVRPAPAHRGVHAPGEIAHLELVAGALDDLQIGVEHGVVECGAHLADASAEFLPHLAVGVSRGGEPAVCLGALAERFVEGERLSGDEHQPVEQLARLFHVGNAVGAAAGERRAHLVAVVAVPKPHHRPVFGELVAEEHGVDLLRGVLGICHGHRDRDRVAVGRRRPGLFGLGNIERTADGGLRHDERLAVKVYLRYVRAARLGRRFGRGGGFRRIRRRGSRRECRCGFFALAVVLAGIGRHDVGIIENFRFGNFGVNVVVQRLKIEGFVRVGGAFVGERCAAAGEEGVAEGGEHRFGVERHAACPFEKGDTVLADDDAALQKLRVDVHGLCLDDGAHLCLVERHIKKIVLVDKTALAEIAALDILYQRAKEAVFAAIVPGGVRRGVGGEAHSRIRGGHGKRVAEREVCRDGVAVVALVAEFEELVARLVPRHAGEIDVRNLYAGVDRIHFVHEQRPRHDKREQEQQHNAHDDNRQLPAPARRGRVRRDGRFA